MIIIIIIGGDSDYLTLLASLLLALIAQCLICIRCLQERKQWKFEILKLSHFDPCLWHHCFKLSLISFCWLHCEGCDGLIPRTEHVLGIMHYATDTQNPGVMRYASWHLCLAYCALCIEALNSTTLTVFDFYIKREIVQNVFLCLFVCLFKWSRLDRSGKVVICPLQAGAGCHDLQVSQIPLKRKRRQQQIGLSSGQWGGDD